jgi:hypothetical protein
VKANGLIREAKWTSEGDGKISWAQAYERRMWIFNVEIILAALIIFAILVVLLFTAWAAFQESLPL